MLVTINYEKSVSIYVAPPITIIMQLVVGRRK